MWNFLRKMISGSTETSVVVSSVNDEVISDAYKKVEKELESLKKYDNGEKEIDAPDLRSSLRSV